MQRNDVTEYSTMASETITYPPPCFTVERVEGCKFPWAAYTHELALQLEREKVN